jgi:mono/diheme cytochrome c family protein
MKRIVWFACGAAGLLALGCGSERGTAGLIGQAQDRDVGSDVVTVEQGGRAVGVHHLASQAWPQDVRDRYYFSDQGSMVIPYDFFLHLETAAGGQLFRDNDNIARFGYLPYAKAVTRGGDRNPDALPIGFVKHVEPATTRFGQTSTVWLGMTCAACHTARISFPGGKNGEVAYDLTGATGPTNLPLLFTELQAAVEATVADPARLAAFAASVAGGSDPKWNDPAQVEQAMRGFAKTNGDFLHSAGVDRQVGYGRIDAKDVVQKVLSAQFGVHSPTLDTDAPINGPFIWGAPATEFVQTNASVGAPLVRNILAIYAGNTDVRFTPGGGQPLFDSSLRFGTASLDDDAMLWTEVALRGLKSPSWSELAEQRLVPPIDVKLAQAGRALYAQNCVGCHVVPGSQDATYTKTKTVPSLAGDGQAQVTRTFARTYVMPPEPLTAQNRVAEAGAAACVGACKSRADIRDGDVYAMTRVMGPGGRPALVRVGDANAVKADPVGTDPTSIQHVAGKLPSVLSASDPIQGAILALLRQNPALPPGTIGSDGSVPGDLLLITLVNQLVDRAFLGRGARLTARGGLDFTGVPALYDEYIEDVNASAGGDPAPLAPSVGYKARSLEGVWATAPFLHNGSVPSLVELLKPPAARMARFHVGSIRFDADNLGFDTSDAPGSSLLDTTLPGNSNAGHDYGTTLGDLEKRQLLEYIKALTSDGEDARIR